MASVHDRLRKACNLSVPAAASAANAAAAAGANAKEVQPRGENVNAQGHKLLYDVNNASNSAVCRGSGATQGRQVEKSELSFMTYRDS
jgi:hypothetical protein